MDLATLVIRRDADNDIKMRGLEIYVDGEFVHDLQFDRTFETRVAPGAHRLTVSNHLYKKSLDLTLEAGQTVTLLAGNRFTLLGGLMVSVLGMGPYRVFLSVDTRPA